MKAAIALQCTTGNCVYQDAAPPPTPSTHQGFWTGEMITLLGMMLVLVSVLFGTFIAALCVRLAVLSMPRGIPTAAAGLFLYHDALASAQLEVEEGDDVDPAAVRHCRNYAELACLTCCCRSQHHTTLASLTC